MPNYLTGEAKSLLVLILNTNPKLRINSENVTY